MDKTTIEVSRKTKAELDRLKIGADTCEDVIRKILIKVDISPELGFKLTNGLFTINCEADFENDHWFYLDELGNPTEILKPRESFINENVQEEYEAFINHINTVADADRNLLDYGAELMVGEIVKLDGFTMERTY